jgi:hypothetical protein
MSVDAITTAPSRPPALTFLLSPNRCWEQPLAEVVETCDDPGALTEHDTQHPILPDRVMLCYLYFDRGRFQI